MSAPAAIPGPLAELIGFFESLPEDERRQSLIAYAEQLARHGPPEGEAMDVADVRKDQECQDTVGIFLKFQPKDAVDVYVSVGEKAQTLTRALAAILCAGLSGAGRDQILDLPHEVIPRLVGGQLFRQRSQTVYYVLTRIKTAVKAWLNRQRREALAAEGAEASAGDACPENSSGGVSRIKGGGACR